MFGKPFYHYTLRKVVASFGALFTNIFVVKRSRNGNEIERIKVPLAYGPAERYLVRNLEDPDLNRNYSVKLPRMSFQITGIEYDSQRKLNTLKKNSVPIENDPGGVIRQYQGVPYKLTIELSILSKYIDDANQIVEQIFPWFTPAFAVTVNSIPGMNYKDDIAIVLNSVNMQDNYDEDWVARRDIVWTLSFDVKIMFYGPMVDKQLITKAITDVYNAGGIDIQNPAQRDQLARVGRATVEPTPDNATYVDEFGYVEKYEGFFDSLRRDTVTGDDVELLRKISPDSIDSGERVAPPTLI